MKRRQAQVKKKGKEKVKRVKKRVGPKRQREERAEGTE